MSTTRDLLVTGSDPDRVAYATGALLATDDFQAEQTYHRGRLARSLAYLHGHGTVAGLRVLVEPATANQEERLIVRGGLAIDRIGRLIEIPRDACLRLDRWYRAQAVDDLVQAFHPRPTPVPSDTLSGVVVDVFARFAVCERGKTPAFAAGPFNALDAVAPSRLRDGYQLDLVLRPEDEPNLPSIAWPDLTEGQTESESATEIEERRRRNLHNALLNAWREGAEHQEGEGLAPLAEHAASQEDTTAVFLARLSIAANAPAAPGAAPVRTAAPPNIDNTSRRFVYPSDAIAHWLNIAAAPTP